MKKPELASNNGVQAVTMERLEELYRQLLAELHKLKLLSQQRGRIDPDFNECKDLGEEVGLGVVPVFKAMHKGLMQLASISPESAEHYYYFVRDHVAPLKKSYPDLFSFWTYGNIKSSGEIQLVRQDISSESADAIVDHSDDDLDDNQRDMMNKFCFNIHMPMPFARVCALFVCENPGFERTILYLWSTMKRAAGTAESDNSSEGAKINTLFKNSYIQAVNGIESAALSFLKELTVVLEDYSETRMMIALSEIGMKTEQLEEFLKIVKSGEDESRASEEGGIPTVQRPRWVMIRRVIIMASKKKAERDNLHLHRLLPEGEGAGLSAMRKEGRHSKEQEKAVEIALDALKQSEKNLKKDYLVFRESLIRFNEDNPTVSDLDNVHLLPHFIALEIQDYQDALKCCIKNRQTAALKSFKRFGEVVEFLCDEYPHIMPDWTINIQDFDYAQEKSPQKKPKKPSTKIVLRDKKQAISRVKPASMELSRVDVGKNILHDLMDKYESKINAARLTKEQRKKMLDIVHRGGAAFTALEELEGIEVKTGDYLFKIDEKQRTLDALSKLSQEMIETIANEMSEPGMVVMPRIPHRKKPGRVILDALDLDALRHHKGQGKSEIVGNKRYAGLLLDQKREDNRVVIMDMTAVLKPMDFCLMDVFAFNTDGSDYCSNIYRKGLRFCNVAEYLVAAHQKMISGYATGFLDIGHKQTVPSDEWDRLVMRGCQYKHKSSQSIVERIYKDNQYHYLAMHFDNGYVLSVINRDYRIARDRYFGVRPAYTLIK